MPAPPSWSTISRCGVSSCACSSSCSRRSSTRHLAAPTERALAFRAFRAEMGQALEQHAVFDALHEHALATGGAWSWQRLAGVAAAAGHSPRSPRSRATHRAARRLLRLPAMAGRSAARGRVRGAPAPRACRSASTRTSRSAVIPASAMAWANPGVTPERRRASGAPPDWFNLHGQNWGLAPLSPVGLREGGVRRVRASAARTTCATPARVRIDHVMGLQRLFWIPEGAAPAEGAYVRYPFDDLARVIALEAGAPSLPGDRRGPRHGAARLSAGDAARGHAVLPGALLRARSRAARFQPPGDYPRRGPGLGRRPTICRRCGASGPRAMSDGGSVLGAFPTRPPPGRPRPSARATGSCCSHALIAPACCPRASIRTGRRRSCPRSWRSRCTATSPPRRGQLVMVQMEDALGEEEQPNLPGTDRASNWRRRLRAILERAGRDVPLVGRSRAADGGRRTAASEVAMAPPIVPRATYRLQFHKDFGFDDARRIVPYLAALGVSHVYASPLTMARPGSTPRLRRHRLQPRSIRSSATRRRSRR